ncbi:precorrin-2 C(20)-methyltransferase [Halotalea alkalilenta]|uniref:Precorrin-2 C(20)-methyltransferase n=1 Tax=Halotalea alkalilenta TaxID=376489 RepID=A0A172YCD3_9GAMM|nr:precorrin-2 C(20)-methyltransferase [Halotalea alkalilenta]ANF56911.1 precorrin-2 C(20)-methyltransferase [Halotalea alkalilenta]
MSGAGRLLGVGVGPGDPELLTLKAVRALEQADLIAYFAKAGNRSHALSVVADFLPRGLERLALEYPVTTELDRFDPEYRRQIDAFYADSARLLAAHLEAGRTVAVLSEGDPLFFGSYMHLHVRLAHRFDAEVIPGVTGMSGGWSSAQLPICQGDDVFSVIPATLDEATLSARLASSEAAVIMKVGRNLAKVRRSLAASGRLERAVYVERATQPGALTLPLTLKADDAAPYFSLVLVPGWSSLEFESPLWTPSEEGR